MITPVGRSALISFAEHDAWYEIIEVNASYIAVKPSDNDLNVMRMRTYRKVTEDNIRVIIPWSAIIAIVWIQDPPSKAEIHSVSEGISERMGL